ncbi:MAG: L-arabinonate dehydratase [Motiliproteus sp.]
MSSDKRKMSPEQLRSFRWFGKDDLRSFGHRSRVKQMGFTSDEFIGRPVIGIINPWNDLNTCHTHFPERVEDIKRGVLRAGGFPVELPAISLGEQLMKPTAMLYRNFLAMEVEELLRSYPIDGCVIMGGCDKTTPAGLMGAFTMNLPTIYIPAGAMIRGHWRGETLGSGTDVWKYWEERRAGNLNDKDWGELEDSIARSPGTCMTMGTAATMMSMADALGLCFTGASSIPAVDSNHIRLCSRSGERIVEMVWEDLKPTDILTKESFENAIRVDMAIGGSTNAIIHLIAMAGRAGIKLTLDDFNRISRDVPLLANVKPSGKYVMEDFYYAGGLNALMAEMSELLNLDTATVSGGTLGAAIEDAKTWNPEVIYPLDKPLKRAGGTAVLRGNLSPNGCVIKPSAMESHLLKHTGPALVYDHIADMKVAMELDDLDVTADTVLVLRNAGPLGAPGMPEWGQLPLPKKLVEQGVRDMLRISDARMSGTSYGACVLHISPESALGGPLALVKNGDMIQLDVEKRSLELLVDDDELARRKAEWKKPDPKGTRGFTRIFTQNITQAHEGCDFEFLQGEPGSTPEPEIF